VLLKFIIKRYSKDYTKDKFKLQKGANTEFGASFYLSAQNTQFRSSSLVFFVVA
jgi:hypothetical protein